MGMTGGEEQQLARRFLDGWAAVERATLPDGTTRTTLYGPQTADSRAAFEALFAANTGLVGSVLRGYRGQGLDDDDLFQEGAIGLMRAIERYDPDRGTRFSTHATWWIRQSMRRAVEATGRAIRLPTYLHIAANRVRDAETRLAVELGRAPSDDEVMCAAHVDAERLSTIRAMAHTLVSLDVVRAHTHDDTPPLVDTLVDETAEFAARTDDAVHDGQLERWVRSVLSAREFAVFWTRAGLATGEVVSLQTIAGHMGISRERVRQIETEARRKLRKALFAADIRDAGTFREAGFERLGSAIAYRRAPQTTVLQAPNVVYWLERFRLLPGGALVEHAETARKTRNRRTSGSLTLAGNGSTDTAVVVTSKPIGQTQRTSASSRSVVTRKSA